MGLRRPTLARLSPAHRPSGTPGWACLARRASLPPLSGALVRDGIMFGSRFIGSNSSKPESCDSRNDPNCDSLRGTSGHCNHDISGAWRPPTQKMEPEPKRTVADRVLVDLLQRWNCLAEFRGRATKRLKTDVRRRPSRQGRLVLDAYRDDVADLGGMKAGLGIGVGRVVLKDRDRLPCFGAAPPP